uniref:Uncharacterized protein n=1 Tax=Arundo donax TaxID=35708 RepID=A0A0A8Y7I7_ARUDO
MGCKASRDRELDRNRSH